MRNYLSTSNQRCALGFHQYRTGVVGRAMFRGLIAAISHGARHVVRHVPGLVVPVGAMRLQSLCKQSAKQEPAGVVRSLLMRLAQDTRTAGSWLAASPRPAPALARRFA